MATSTHHDLTNGRITITGPYDTREHGQGWILTATTPTGELAARRLADHPDAIPPLTTQLTAELALARALADNRVRLAASIRPRTR